MTEDEATIIRGIAELGAVGLDELDAALALGVPRLVSAILGLERRGDLVRSPGGTFDLVRPRRRGEPGAWSSGTS